MQIRLTSSSVSMSIKALGFGVNAVSGSYIQIRQGEGTPIQLLGLADKFSLGAKNGTVVFAQITTDWIDVDSAKYPWICNAPSLAGKLIDIDISGTVLNRGTADVKMTLINGDGESESLVSKMNINVNGFQLANLKVRARLKYLGKKENKNLEMCRP